MSPRELALRSILSALESRRQESPHVEAAYEVVGELLVAAGSTDAWAAANGRAQRAGLLGQLIRLNLPVEVLRLFRHLN